MSNKLFKSKQTIKVIWFFLIFFCVLSFFLLPKLDEIHFAVESIFCFYGLFGFFAFIFIVLVAKHLIRPIVERKEDYYD